ncbi:MAG: CBS domain-containing protein [Synergistetes bacterium]|nr:CBS domain-containing protein [Synergistota bacterium]
MIKPSEIIVTHKGADFDALASMVAASKLHPAAVMVFSGSADRNVREYLATSGSWIEVYTPRKVSTELVNKVVVVDTNALENLDKFSDVAFKDGIELWLYDHHPLRDMGVSFRGVVKGVGATTTLLVLILKEKRMFISKDEATLFALGIYEDTGMFTFASTTEQDFMAAMYLLELGADVTVVPHFLSVSLSAEQQRVFNLMVDGAEEEYIGGLKVVFTTVDVKGYMEGLALLVHKLRDFFAADVVVAMAITGSHVYVIMRSRGKVDVNVLASGFGGGGHKYAASVVIDVSSIVTVKERLRKEISELTRDEKLVRDAMTSPVKSVEPNATVEDVLNIMVRYGHSGLPVIENDRLVGIITRKDLDKAKFHGLGKQKIEKYMSVDVVTVSENAPLDEAHRLMVKNRIGRLPVVGLKGVVGIITRTDLLKALYRGAGSVVDETISDGVIVKGNIWNKIQAQLSPQIVDILKAFGDLGSKKRWNVYLIGGSVRDILLGKSSIDIDLVVEGNGIELASLWKSKGFKVYEFPEFGTASMVSPDGIKVDIATARREYYEYPASLPKVEFGSLKHDLYRRDFTINAMAVQLNDEGKRGRLIDYFGGLEDLRYGVIRILHNLSFVEDPTRIIRAVRFEQRFGFVIERKTMRLLRGSIEQGLLGQLSGKRILNELNAVFAERRAWKMVTRMYEIGVLDVIFPNIKLGADKVKEMRKLTWVLGKGHFAYVRKWMMFFMVLLRGMNNDDISVVSERFNMSKNDRELLYGIGNLRHLIEMLSAKELKNSELYTTLNALSLEQLCYVYTIGSSTIRKRVVYYLDVLVHVKPSITGKDLMRMGIAPGPLYKQLLEKVKLAIMDGYLKGLEDQMRFIERELKKC